EVPGLFGSGELYQNERLTWFQEGNAEFFAGSTRTNNVVPRKSIISGLSSDPASRYTAKQTLFAKYGSWDFYKYSFALQSYLYNHQFDTFDKIQDLIRANDVRNYDAYRELLSKNTQLNAEYQAYMQQLIDNQDKYNVPQVTNDYLIQHAPKPLAEVKNEIVDVANIKDAQITKYESQFFNTFIVEGKYTGGTSKGESEDWKAMSKQVNQTLEQLSQKEWSGYKTVTAYFVNYRVNAANQYEYDIVFHGVATEEKEKTTTIVNMNGPYSGIVNEEIHFHSDGTTSENGKVISYLWNFGDGTTSTKANPTHVYGEKGTYTVELTVKDSRGKESKEQTKVTVKQDPQTGGSLEEEKLLPFNTLVKGNLVTPDQTDVYTFNVTDSKEVDISVVNEQNIGMTWVLYHESDMQNYVACGEDEGNTIKGKFVAKPGKYYLNVYKFDDKNGEYSLLVK
ncbi:collagenase, partial [Bacillus cereus]